MVALIEVRKTYLAHVKINRGTENVPRAQKPIEVRKPYLEHKELIEVRKPYLAQGSTNRGTVSVPRI